MGLFGVYDSYYKHTSKGVKDYLSSRNKLKLDYQGRPSLTYSGFRILITAFKGKLFLLDTSELIVVLSNKMCFIRQTLINPSFMCHSNTELQLCGYLPLE